MRLSSLGGRLVAAANLDQSLILVRQRQLFFDVETGFLAEVRFDAGLLGGARGLLLSDELRLAAVGGGLVGCPRRTRASALGRHHHLEGSWLAHRLECSRCIV